MPRTHELPRDAVHHAWDRALPAALEIAPGDTVVLHCRDAREGRESDSAAALAADPIRGHPLSGPIRVAGARPGDTLRIEVLDLVPGDTGWTFFRPGAGLLPDDFTAPYLKVWELRDGVAELRPGVRVPLEPFLGVMGVALAAPGEHPTAPPRPEGGNLDVKLLAMGSALLLPIAVDGALFSAGDGHAAQGDGEACVTAIETSMRATLRFDLLRDRRITAPEVEVPAARAAGRSHATVGVDADPIAAARQAVRGMIAYLAGVHGLTREEAYVLCSVAADLRFSQAAGAARVVTAVLPLGVFGGGASSG